MTDDELSNLLQEWKRTPAPSTLTARVFGSRRPPSPSWWDRIPGSFIPVTGAVAGALGMWALITLASAYWTHPIPSSVVQQAAPPAPAVPPAAEVQLPPATKPPTRNRRTKPVAVPAAQNLATVSPRLISAPVPAYPADAPPLVLTTTVKLRIRVGKDGRVMEASVIDGDPRLDALAVEAVKTWLYEPVLLNGVPVEAVTEVNVDFQTKPKKVKK